MKSNLLKGSTLEALENADEEITVEYILSRGRHKTPEDFSIFIEKTVQRTGERYLDALLDYCEENGIELESIAKSLTASLRQKIEAECESLNLLKTKNNRLPE